MILNLFSIPSYLPCFDSEVLFAPGYEPFTTASFVQQNGPNKVEW